MTWRRAVSKNFHSLSFELVIPCCWSLLLFGALFVLGSWAFLWAMALARASSALIVSRSISAETKSCVMCVLCRLLMELLLGIIRFETKDFVGS